EGLSYTFCALGGVQRMRGRYDLSQAYYQEANTAMRKRGDAFGTAYSFCGLGNAARMCGDLKTALAFFHRAERGYGRIGDKVSYAYTLWSLGTTHKSLGLLVQAAANFRRGARLFRSTGDRRGLAYVELGLAEVAALRGHRSETLKRWKLSARWARGFAWEVRHARAFKALLSGKTGAARAAYADSGSRFQPTSLPVAWP
ncbi:MAG: tetratricopeptide repeat protein, partial [bacterium]